jgi:AmmeMemoRadiSam system protein B
MQKIRRPAVAGSFYPADKTELQNQINMLLDITKPEEDIRDILGIIAPHAGYIYSGKTAAFAFNTIANKIYETVIIISPSHREYFPGISIYDGDAYATPLGVVEINNDIRQKLITENIFQGIEGHRNEHAIEVEIPFLQSVLKDFTIVPIVMGNQNKNNIDELSQKLSEIIDDKTLIVASSDLSHFYTRKEAQELDSRVKRRIQDFDFEGLQNDLGARNVEACGGGCIVSLMKAASLKNTNKSKVLSYSDSGYITGDTMEVVGYLSAVIHN